MTARSALRCLSDLDLSYIADAEQTPVRRFRPRALIAAAACVALLGALGGVFAFHKPSAPPLITSYALNEASDKDLVTIYEGSNYLEACYAAPRNGDVLLYIELTLAMEEHASEDVLYWVRLDVMSEDGTINFTEAEADAEVARLAALGYDLYTHKKNWIGYWGEDKHYTTICAKMSANELRAFESVAADKRYGYAFDFAHHLTVDDCTQYEMP